MSLFHCIHVLYPCKIPHGRMLEQISKIGDGTTKSQAELFGIQLNRNCNCHCHCHSDKIWVFVPSNETAMQLVSYSSLVTRLTLRYIPHTDLALHCIFQSMFYRTKRIPAGFCEKILIIVKFFCLHPQITHSHTCMQLIPYSTVYCTSQSETTSIDV